MVLWGNVAFAGLVAVAEWRRERPLIPPPSRRQALTLSPDGGERTHGRTELGRGPELDMTRDVSWWAAITNALEKRMGIIWTIIIGFIAGVIAKLIHSGNNEPQGFVLTTILGIVGAFVATYLGQALGWYRADEGAGLIGAVIGALIVLGIWGALTGRRRAV